MYWMMTLSVITLELAEEVIGRRNNLIIALVSPILRSAKCREKQLMAVLLGVSKFCLISTRKGIEAD